MSNQTTRTILMIKPIAFGFNPETAVNNYFQQENKLPYSAIQNLARDEFSAMVMQLRVKGIQVIVVKDTPEPHTPDSIFPNNWISFHEDGRVVLYPMFAQNRRLERRMDIIRIVREKGFKVTDLVDYTDHESNNHFLEGTGSMILDRDNKIAYAALSERTNLDVFELFCSEFGYQPISFSAYQSINKQRLPIYHTNVMLCVADKFVVVCLASIDNEAEKETLKSSFSKTGKDIIEITEKQMNCFAGNMLQVSNQDGKLFLVMSLSAYDSLTKEQILKLETYNELIIVPVSTIESAGGGSVRCMMLEVFGE